MIKKTFLTFAVTAIALGLSSCGDKSENQTQQVSQPTAADLQAQRDAAEKDSLIALFNDIYGDMMQIKEVESIITVPRVNGEKTSAPLLRDDIQAIRQTLQERRERLAELEKALSSKSGENSQLTQMIANLKENIAQNEATINTLTEQLQIANDQIASLNVQVDSLNTSVATATAEKQAAEETNQKLTNEMNRVYYAIGSGSELKEHKLVESKFLRKTKVLQNGDFDEAYFTVADKRTLTSIPLASKKAKVMTGQPEDSYTITENANGTKVLNITNPTRFWNAGIYLIVKTD